MILNSEYHYSFEIKAIDSLLDNTMSILLFQLHEAIV